MRLQTHKPSSEAISNQPTENEGKAGQGAATDRVPEEQCDWGAEGPKHRDQKLGTNMAPREQRARVSVCQYFPRAVPGIGCHGFVLQTEKLQSQEGQYLTPSVTPWALTPSHLTFLISVSPLPNTVVCTKEAINALLFKNVDFCSLSAPTF